MFPNVQGYCHKHKNHQIYRIILTKIRTNVNLVPNPDHKTKKNKNKNMTCAKQKSNMILLQEGNKNKTRLWQENIPQTGVEHTEGNGEFYFNLHPFDT